jgi:hypothetical protein
LKPPEDDFTVANFAFKPFFGFGWIETAKGHTRQIKKNDLPCMAFRRFNS